MRRFLCLCILPAACGLPPADTDVDYAAMFVPDRLVQWNISVSDDNWHELRNHPASYVAANIDVDGVTYNDVGLRLIGNTNRPKIGMRIRFNELNPSLTFHGVKRVSLKSSAGDPSLVREALALLLMRKAGIPAPRASFVWVDWGGGGGGVYTLVEQVDRRFLEDRFGEDDGNLYKVDLGGNLVAYGDDPSHYDWLTTYELKTNEEYPDHSALVRLMQVLAIPSVENLQEQLPRMLDVDGFLRLLAVNTWLANMDAYAGTARGYYLYHDESGRFRVIAWDLNRAFGNYHGRHCKLAADENRCADQITEYCTSQCADPACIDGCVEEYRELYVEHWPEATHVCDGGPPEYCEYTTDELLALDPDNPTCSVDRPLIHKTLMVPAFRQRYHELLGSLIDKALAPDEVVESMNSMRELLSERAAEDVLRDHACVKEGDECAQADFDAPFFADSMLGEQDEWDFRVPGLVPFIMARDDFVRDHLEDFE